jgi:hypothetical protein
MGELLQTHSTSLDGQACSALPPCSRFRLGCPVVPGTNHVEPSADAPPRPTVVVPVLVGTRRRFPASDAFLSLLVRGLSSTASTLYPGLRRASLLSRPSLIGSRSNRTRRVTASASDSEAERRRAETLARRRDVAIAATALAALVTSFVVSRSAVENGPVLYPLRLVAGVPGPGCGLTRSWVALAHGDLGTAFARNAFGPLLFALAIFAVASVVHSLARRRAPVDLAACAASRPALALAAVWSVWWIVSLIA